MGIARPSNSGGRSGWPGPEPGRDVPLASPGRPSDCIGLACTAASSLRKMNHEFPRKFPVGHASYGMTGFLTTSILISFFTGQEPAGDEERSS